MRCAGAASTSSMALGTLKPARRGGAVGAQLRGIGGRAQDDGAVTASPHSASGRPNTPASATAGCWSSAASTSAGMTFSPPVTIVSTLRPETIRRPWASRRPRSPVRRMPPPATVGPATTISSSGAIETSRPGSGRPEVATSPGSATVTAEQACVSP